MEDATLSSGPISLNVPPAPVKSHAFVYTLLVLTIIVLAGIVIFLFMKQDPSTDTGEKNYGNDLKGFINAAQTCELSTVKYNAHSEMMGLRSDTLWQLKIEGKQNGSCSFSMEILNYTYNEPQGANQGGDFLNVIVGHKKSCNYPPATLVNVLKNLEAGDVFSMAAEESKYCKEQEAIDSSAVQKQDVVNTKQCQSEGDCPAVSCANCRTGKQTCLIVRDSPSGNFCGECYSGLECKAFYKCSQNKCVPQTS